MKRFRSMILSLFIPAAVHAAGRIPDDVAEHVHKRIEAGDCVGVVVCVVDDAGSCCLSDGLMAKGSDRKVDEKTVFEIGSITKAFTATLLADMVLRGEVALDDPVEKYLPPGSKVPARNGKQITLRHLATHRSGLPRLPDNIEPADPDNPYADYTEKRMLDFLSKYELTRDPGEQYEYSNFGAGLLGFVLARKAGKPYEQLVIERVCTPLHMKNTRITLTDDMKSRLASGHADGKPVKNWDLDALAGAGALRATPLDMVNLIEANLKLADTPISKALQASYKDRTATGKADLSMGLGWHVWNRHDTTVIWHNGGTGGYRSFCGFSPEKKLGVVVLSNSNIGLDEVGLHILDPKVELPEVKKPANVDAAKLEDFVGYYEITPEIVISITHEGDQLFAQVTGQPKLPLFAESDSKFFLKVVDAKIDFVRGSNGKVSHLILHQNGDHKCERVDDYKPLVQTEVAVDPKILEQYVGKYELKPGLVFDVKLEEGQLRVQITGQPRLPVFPKAENKFFYKVVEAQLTFQKDESGKVTSVVLHQGGIDQTAKRKE